jgi:5-methylcytosine-specific restriction endonuclease McrA
MALSQAERDARYYKRHKAAILARRDLSKIIAWQKRHAARFKAAQRRYGASPKGKRTMRASAANRRARKLDQFIENVDPEIVYEMHGGMCGICKKFIDGDFHVDHVIPLVKGGMHGYVNVQPAHPSCNLRKGAT